MSSFYVPTYISCSFTGPSFPTMSISQVIKQQVAENRDYLSEEADKLAKFKDLTEFYARIRDKVGEFNNRVFASFRTCNEYKLAVQNGMIKVFTLHDLFGRIAFVHNCVKYNNDLPEDAVADLKLQTIWHGCVVNNGVTLSQYEELRKLKGDSNCLFHQPLSTDDATIMVSHIPLPSHCAHMKEALLAMLKVL